MTEPEKTVFVANVTFESGFRNNRHIHRAKDGGGQLLICIDDEGWYQEEDKPARSLKPRDVVTIPANVKHGHGAKANSWFSHLAMECPPVKKPLPNGWNLSMRGIMMHWKNKK